MIKGFYSDTIEELKINVKVMNCDFMCLSSSILKILPLFVVLKVFEIK